MGGTPKISIYRSDFPRFSLYKPPILGIDPMTMETPIYFAKSMTPNSLDHEDLEDSSAGGQLCPPLRSAPSAPLR